MTDPRPCPFCGATEVETLDCAVGPGPHDNPLVYFYTTFCKVCGAQGPSWNGDMSKTQAIDAWNTRA